MSNSFKKYLKNKVKKKWYSYVNPAKSSYLQFQVLGRLRQDAHCNPEQDDELFISLSDRRQFCLKNKDFHIKRKQQLISKKIKHYFSWINFKVINSHSRRK